MTRDEAILYGARAAVDLHTKLDLRTKAETDGAPIDIFSSIEQVGAALLFTELDGLLGLCMPKPSPGILVTTQRDLHVQRFTAAHELGHLALGHSGSLDDENTIFNRKAQSADPQEISADTFASEFLMPRWLCISHARRQNWKKESLTDPNTLYQLSLRLGVSYSAACWGLFSNKVFNKSEADALAKVAPKTIKQNLLNGIPLNDSWANVWRLTECDAGTTIEGNPNDILILDLVEDGPAGFEWGIEAANTQGFNVLEDVTQEIKSRQVGAAILRRIALQVRAGGARELTLQENQPWGGGLKGRELTIKIVQHGRHAAGLTETGKNLLLAS